MVFFIKISRLDCFALADEPHMSLTSRHVILSMNAQLITNGHRLKKTIAVGNRSSFRIIQNHYTEMTPQDGCTDAEIIRLERKMRWQQFFPLIRYMHQRGRGGISSLIRGCLQHEEGQRRRTNYAHKACFFSKHSNQIHNLSVTKYTFL